MSDLSTPWTAALQAPLSMGFCRQECWNGMPCPPPGDLSKPGIEPASLISPALAGGFFTPSAPGKLRTTWSKSEESCPFFLLHPPDRPLVSPLGRNEQSSVQWLSCVWLSTTAWTATCQASLFIITPELAQTLVHWVSDAIQPSQSLSSPSPLAFSLSKHQGLLQWVSSLHQVAKVLEFQS